MSAFRERPGVPLHDPALERRPRRRRLLQPQQQRLRRALPPAGRAAGRHAALLQRRSPTTTRRSQQTVGGGFSLSVHDAVHAVRACTRSRRSRTATTRRRRSAPAACASASSPIRRRRPNNDLLVVWTPGPANDLNRPTTHARTTTPASTSIPGGDIVNSPSELVLIKNDPDYNEAWPRAVVPYRAVHGVAEPAQLPWLPNDGTLHAGAARRHAVRPRRHQQRLQARELPRLRAAVVEHLRRPRRLQHHRERPEQQLGVRRARDAGKYANSDIWAIRIARRWSRTRTAATARNGGPSGGPLFSSHAMERLRILGEIPLRKFDPGGQPILDPEGNPDTSFLAKIPADTPFTFQTLDRNGMVLNMAQTWHQVRPGEVRNDCGGCHAHSQQPLAFASTAAAQPGYQVADLTHDDAAADHGRAAAIRRCARSTRRWSTSSSSATSARSCSAAACRATPRTTANPPGNLVLDDYADRTAACPATTRASPTTRARAGAIPPVGRLRLAADQRQPLRAHVPEPAQPADVEALRRSASTAGRNADHPTESTPGDASDAAAGRRSPTPPISTSPARSCRRRAAACRRSATTRR